MAINRGILFAAMAACCLTGCGADEASDRPLPSMLGGSMASASGSASSGANAAPIVDRVELRPANPAPGRTVRALASIRDEDGDTTRVRYVWKTSIGRVLAEGRSFDSRGLGEGERLQVVVTATDGKQESAPFVHEFRLAETSVEIALVAIDASRGTQPGSVFEAVVESTAEDRGSYEVVLEWKVNGEVVGREEELDTTLFAPGEVVELKARLDFGGRVTRPVSSRPVKLARGEAPTILSEPRVGVEGGVFRYRIRATSSEPNGRVSYALLKGPEGMTVDASSGQISWRPGEDQRGAFGVEVAAADQWGSASAQSFRIQVDAPVAPPASAR
ncbi:MAG: hypothetical protein CL933_11065 [Deltaproteobacteria bacterium]|nr:hypothetical protein [Deltaproteobacteria bacterium]